jgi:hypothetical protein
MNEFHLRTPLPFDIPKWAEHLNANDPLAMVVRAHLYVESILNRRIERLLVKKGRLNVVKLKFEMKLNIAASFGAIPDEDYPALKKLNDFRNGFAHNLEKQLTEEDERDLYNCLSAHQRRIVNSILDRNGPKCPFIGRLRADLGGLIAATNEEVMRADHST